MWSCQRENCGLAISIRLKLSGTLEVVAELCVVGCSGNEQLGEYYEILQMVFRVTQRPHRNQNAFAKISVLDFTSHVKFCEKRRIVVFVRQ